MLLLCSTKTKLQCLQTVLITSTELQEGTRDAGGQVLEEVSTNQTTCT